MVSATKRSTAKMFDRVVAFTEDIMRFWKSYLVTQGILCTRSPLSAPAPLIIPLPNSILWEGCLLSQSFWLCLFLILKCFTLDSESFCELKQCSYNLSAFKTKQREWEEIKKNAISQNIFKSFNSIKVILSLWVTYLLLTLFWLNLCVDETLACDQL